MLVMKTAADRQNTEPEAEDDGEPRSVRDVVSRLEALAGREQVALRDLIAAGGNASFVPALMVPALLVVSPLSGIPLFSSLCGITIALISAQMLWNRDHLSLPNFVVKRQVAGPKLRGALKRMRGAADFLDRHSRDDRLYRLIGRSRCIVPQSLCLIAGLLMPVLEIIPFSSSILGTAVLCFAVSCLTRDGLFVVFGMAIMAALALLPFFVLTGT